MMSVEVRLLPRPFSWSPGSVVQHVQAACWSPELRSTVSSHKPSPSVHGHQFSTGTGFGQASPPSANNRDGCYHFSSI